MMKQRTVLHVIDTGGPGGAETIYHNLVTGLNPERWRSIAIIPERDWLFEALREHGVEPLVVPTHGSFDARYAITLSRLITRHKVSLVQAHLLTSAVYASSAARLAGIPVVCTFHGTADVPQHERFKKLKVAAFDRPSNRIVFVSESLRRAFAQRFRIRRAATDVVYNGIDPLPFRSARSESIRSEFGFTRDDVVIGAIGNVRLSKAYDVLLRAAALLKDERHRFKVLIAGDTRTPLYDELLTLRHELGLDEQVVFAGFRPDVDRVLEAVDIFALSSRAEGFSLATVQAMTAGVPVVATRCGGPEDIIDDGATGLLVENDSPAALEAGIRKIANNAELADTLRNAARTIAVKRFSRIAMIGGYEVLYERCTAEVSGLDVVESAVSATAS